MPALPNNLVNNLAGMAHRLRQLQTTFGLDQWQVYRCTRTWSGARRGMGTLGAEAAVLMVPTPRVLLNMRKDLLATGLDEAGDCTLAEVSLIADDGTNARTEASLDTKTTTANVEVYYKLVDAQGGGQPDRFFVVSRVVTPDRETDLGWTVVLRSREVPT